MEQSDPIQPIQARANLKKKRVPTLACLLIVSNFKFPTLQLASVKSLNRVGCVRLVVKGDRSVAFRMPRSWRSHDFGPSHVAALSKVVLQFAPRRFVREVSHVQLGSFLAAERGAVTERERAGTSEGTLYRVGCFSTFYRRL